jgi:hypothetical protein
METTHEAYFERFTLNLTEEQAKSGSHQGECDDDIAVLLEVPEIARQLDSILPSNLVKELLEYGAWDEAELLDHEANKARILWIACGNILDDIREMESESKQ